MIYFNDGLDNYLDCLIECSYLTETLCSRNSMSNVYVQPDNPTFISFEKTVIITRPDYPKEKLELLMSNGCNIISRVPWPEYKDNIKFQPYILYFCPRVYWNGSTITGMSYISPKDIISKGRVDYDEESGILYFPKIYGLSREQLVSESGDLTSIGWVLQQVGVNVISDTEFIDLDILKTGKTLFRTS